MDNEPKSEIGSPLHILKCALELGYMAINEFMRSMDDAMDVFDSKD